MNKTSRIILSLLAVTAMGTAQAQTALKLSIDSMFSLLERNNTSLIAGKSQIEVAERGIDVAKDARFPDIDASLQFSYIGNALMTDRDFSNAKGLSSPHFGNALHVQVVQPLYAGGAISTGIKIAGINRDLAVTNTSLTRNQARYGVLCQYLELYRIDNAMCVVDSNITLAQRLIDQISVKHSQGVALSNDVTRYQVQLESLRLKRTTLVNRRRVACHQLCSALGLKQDVTLVPDSSVAHIANVDATEAVWQQTASSGALQLKLSRLNEQMCSQQLRLARSEMLPSVALVAANNFDGPFTYDLPPVNKNINVWYVGLGVKYSLSSLYKGRRKVRQAEAALRQSQDAIMQTSTAVDDAMQQACVAFSQAKSELATQQRQVQLARQNYAVMNDRYVNQLVLVTDMIDAANTLLNAEILEVDARIGIAQAYYSMKYIAGDL